MSLVASYIKDGHRMRLLDLSVSLKHYISAPQTSPSFDVSEGIKLAPLDPVFAPHLAPGSQIIASLITLGLGSPAQILADDASATFSATNQAAPVLSLKTLLPDGTPLTADTITARGYTGTAAALAFSKMPIVRNIEFRDRAALRCDPLAEDALPSYRTACAGYIVGVEATRGCDHFEGVAKARKAKSVKEKAGKRKSGKGKARKAKAKKAPKPVSHNGAFLRPVYVPGYLNGACCTCHFRHHPKDCHNLRH